MNYLHDDKEWLQSLQQEIKTKAQKIFFIVHFLPREIISCCIIYSRWRHFSLCIRRCVCWSPQHSPNKVVTN